MNERELALREKAQEFLNQKARVKHYRISGVFNEEYGDGDTWAIFEYTDEEVARLKHLFSEALDSFRGYLEAEGIAYEYAMETRGVRIDFLLNVDGVMKRDTVDYLWWLRIVDDRRKKVFCTNTFVGKEKIQQT